MARPKRREQETLFDPELGELPDGARWREWMGRVEAAIFSARDPVQRETLARLVGPRCNLDELIADIVDELRGRCHVALNCKNAPVRARYCSLFENLLGRNYQLCCNNDNVAGLGRMLSMVEASSLKRVRF